MSYATRPTATTGMPTGVPFIIGNEAAERFSFYGMKSILTIFMVDYLHRMGAVESAIGMSDAQATEQYHTFTFLVYLFPVFGAVISDVFLGKYRTILWLSIVYCVGHAALAMMGSSVGSANAWLGSGLLLISIGAGGIKPCVSAHVGDQFGVANQHLLEKVYQWFYFSINAGAFLSTLLTPWLLEHHGPHWAFGVPGVLMALATFLFWLGRNRFVHVPPGGMRFLKETFSWEGISTVLKLSVIFAFVAVFWALFDQTGSSWVLQSKNLNRNWLGIEWLESQIQAVNPILILILIPVFQFVVYPAVGRLVRLTPIRKISAGLFIMTLGFGLVSLLQQRIDGGDRPNIAWQFLAYGVLTASEVLVSITCLEFAYTQAPKTMKSVVMAVFLFSVSLGNLFTAVVNRYIQTPAVAAVATEVNFETLASGQTLTAAGWKAVAQSVGEKTATLVEGGPDGQPGTPDDVTLTLDSDGVLQSIRDASYDAFVAASQKIEAAYFAQPGDDTTRNLPDEASVAALIAEDQDAFGNPIVYHVVSRDRFQLVSRGADKKDKTRYDEIMTVDLSRAEPTDGKTDANATPYFNWLDRRLIMLRGGDDPIRVEAAKQEILASRVGGVSTTFSRDYAVGGRVLLEGADYFWFWTKCILVTAILFVPVGYLYKEKTYIQDGEV